jgi:outer membrane protein assembly factor BamB
VTDGERVIVWHGSAGLYAYDLDGKELWKVDLGEFKHIWGNASSPVLHGDSVILNAGPGERSFLIALDKRTGEELWRNDLQPPAGESERPQPSRRGWSGSWSTPVLTEIEGRTQLILSLPHELVAFDPADGKRLWWCDGLTQLVYTSPLVGPEVIVAMSGYGGAAIAVRTEGLGEMTGNVTETHRLWRHERNPQRVGSGTLVGEHLYILHDTGVAWCLDTKTGEKAWEARLSGTWTSMVHAAGRLYVIATNGTTYVLEPTPAECKTLAENKLGETTRASLAFSDGRIFIRTYKHLYCIEDTKDAPKAAAE